MKKTWIVIAIVVIVALATLLIITQIKRGAGEIKIGAILPLTGETAQLGEWARNGLILAEEYVNSYKGKKEKPIKIIFEDGMADPKTSLNAFQKLIELDKTKIILSIISSVDLTLIPSAEKHRVLFFSHAAHPMISGIGPLIFRHSQVAYQEAGLMSATLPENIKKVVLAYMNDDYTIALKNGLIDKLAGKNINLDTIMFEKNEISFYTEASKILDKKPEYLLIAGYGKNSGLLIKRLKEMGYKGQIMVNLGFIVSGAVLSAGESIKDVNGINFEIDINQEGYYQINQLYKNKYGKEIPISALLFFNSVYLLNSAIERVGYDPLKIAAFLKEMKSFQGLGEKINITEKNDILPSLKIIKL